MVTIILTDDQYQELLGILENATSDRKTVIYEFSSSIANDIQEDIPPLEAFQSLIESLAKKGNDNGQTASTT